MVECLHSYVNDENLNRVAANDDKTIECGIGVLKMVWIQLDILYFNKMMQNHCKHSTMSTLIPPLYHETIPHTQLFGKFGSIVPSFPIFRGIRLHRPKFPHYSGGTHE